ncbi:MAG: sodium:solute symporter family protein [Parachlamydiales bacterium]|nr:sodium:solute symporter family protein [Parachlamydiales bacterium]
MNQTFFVIALFSLQILYWIVGKFSSRKLKGKEDYFLAGKNVRFFPLMMTFLATQVGGGAVLGAADEAYRYGWSVLLYPLGASLGLIALGLGIGKRLAQFPVSTVAQILEIVYGSSSLKKVASALSVLSLFMVLVGQIVASKKFLLAIGFTNTPLFILFWGIIIFYTVRGGLKAVIATDISQAIFFAGAFLVTFAAVSSNTPWQPTVESFANASSKWTGWLLMPLLFMIIGQDMGQRCFAGNSASTVSKATFWAGIGTMIICFVPVFFGVIAKNLGLFIPQGSSVLMVAIEALTNPTTSAIIGCAVIAAIISTATSLINAISSNLSQDFFKNRESLRFMRSLTAILSIASIFFAFYCNNIVDILIQSYELSLSCLFIPIFIALFRPRGELLSAVLAVLFGICSFCIFKAFPPPLPSEVASILVSLAGFLSGEWLAQAKKKKALRT